MQTLQNYACAAIADEARGIVMASEAERAKAPKPYNPTEDGVDPTVPWRGIFKVMEEAGELIVELAKLSAFPSGTYPDPNRPKLLVGVVEEASDLIASLEYFMETNGIPLNRQRIARKKAKFQEWGLSGVVKDTTTDEA